MSISPSASNNAGQQVVQELRELSLDMIVASPSQPRRHFDDEALHELAGSMGERGVLQPVLVRPLRDGMYQLVAGERRWRAARIAGLERIPALVSAYDDAVALQIALIENMAREDLNPVEQARACNTLVKELGLNQGQVGQLVGRHNTVVSNLIGLLNLSEEILGFLERGDLSESHGITLLKAKDPEARQQLARAAVQEGWSLRALQARVRKSNVDLLESLQDRGEQARDPKQARDLEAVNVARAWGDLLGAEVHVRPIRKERMRIEVEFDFASEGIALAERLASVVAGGSTSR
jgi:ParB family chromosome partitioning protein